MKCKIQLPSSISFPRLGIKEVDSLDGMNTGLLPMYRPRSSKVMGMPKVAEFLCGVPVRLGALVIGYVSLLSGLVVCMPALIFGSNLREFILHVNNRTVTGLIEDNASMAAEITKANSDVANILSTAILTVLIVVGTIITLISALLIIGIQKEIRCCMIPWLIMQGAFTGLSILGAALTLLLPVLLFESFVAAPFFSTYMYFGQIGSAIVGTCVTGYLFIVVRTHYDDLKIPARTLGFTHDKL